MPEKEKEATMISYCQGQQKARPLALDKYCVLDIETKVQEIQEEEALWTNFVYEEESRDAKPKKIEVEQDEKVASKVEEVKGEASVSAQVQDSLEEVNLGKGSVQ